MKQTPLNPAPGGGQILDLWTCGMILWKRRRLVVLLPLVGALACGVVSLLLPKIYESSAVFVPLKRPDLLKAVNMNALMGSLGGDSFAVPDDLLQYSELANAEGIGKDECIALLHSQAMRDDILREIDRWPLDDESRLNELRKELEDDTWVTTVERRPTISITVRRADAQEAADIANFYVAHLDDTLNRNLTKRRERLRRYVQQQLDVLDRFNLQSESSPAADDSESPSRTGTKEGNERVESLRENLSRMVEWLRLTESAELPLVEMLDEAVPATRQSSPRVIVNVMAAFVALIMVGTLLAFVLEYIESEKSRRISSEG